MDEVGRGPLAGPLVAAAVILPDHFEETARKQKIIIRDSKTLSVLQRERAYHLIVDHALAYEIAQMSVDKINERGIGWANRAVFEALIPRIEADYYVIDGRLKLSVSPDYWGRVESKRKADETVLAVSAAAILAKVTRDRQMAQLDVQYPQYGWAHNQGYGTAEHLRALSEYGTSLHHRTQFVSTALGNFARKAPTHDPLDFGEE
jgi:ribonuclease HII